MKDLEWTDEPPEESGFYLYRFSDHDVSAAANVMSENGTMVALLTGGEDKVPVGDYGGEWAGPIPEPE